MEGFAEINHHCVGVGGAVDADVFLEGSFVAVI